MDFLKFFTVLCTAAVVFTAAAKESEPMRIFKEFRNAAIQNDSASALMLTDGEIMEQIRNAGAIPANLRKQLILINAAYEDIHVRLSDAKKAVVYGFALENGKLICAEFVFESNANAVLKIIKLNVGAHLARPHLENFLTACRTNNIARYRDLITPEVTEKYPRIPASLKAGADEKISEGQATADSADFTVDRGGIKGKISMKKSEYFWKVSFIDDILLAPMPSQIVEELCKAANGVTDAEAVRKYFSENSFESLKEKLSAEKLAVLSGMNAVLSQKSSGTRKFYVEVKISNATDSGIVSFNLDFTNDGWKVANFDADSLVYKNDFAPAVTAEKAAVLLLKERNTEALKELLPEALLTKLTESITDPSPEMTITVDEEKIERKNTTVTASITNSAKVGKMSFTMKLENGKWNITDIQTEEPPKAEENAANSEGAAEGASAE